MVEGCSTFRHFSWFPKACIPNAQEACCTIFQPVPASIIVLNPSLAGISILPDDLLLECLTRVPSSSLSSISLVCRRWSQLLLSQHFLSLRRLRCLLLPVVLVLSSSPNNSTLIVASLSALDRPWKLGPFIPFQSGMPIDVSQSRLSAVGPRIYIIGRDEVLCYDAWTGAVSSRSPMISPPRRFSTVVANGKIYAVGGPELVEYDAEKNKWRVVSRSPRTRYGCTASYIDGVVYVIGGLKVGTSELPRMVAGAEARVYAWSMDLYDVEGRVWLRSRAVPGGGCVVAACTVAGHLYILASHAVDISFWRFDARRKGGSIGGGVSDWCKLKSPPLPPQTRLDSRVRFTCVELDDKIVLIQVSGSIDDLLRRSGRSARGIKEGLVLIYDSSSEEWLRGPDLPEVVQRAACVSVEC